MDFRVIIKVWINACYENEAIKVQIQQQVVVWNVNLLDRQSLDTNCKLKVVGWLFNDLLKTV